MVLVGRIVGPCLGQVIHFDLPYQMDVETPFCSDTSHQKISMGFELVADDFHCRYAKHSGAWRAGRG